MEYFVSHIGYVLLIGLFVAVLGILTAVFAQKSQKLNEEHGYDPAWDKSEYACAGCRFTQMCSGMAALKPKDAADEIHDMAQEIRRENGETACGHDPILREDAQAAGADGAES